MKKSLSTVVIILSVVVNYSCLKEKTCSPKTPASEASQIQNYASMNSIAATAHSSGLYYEILDPGTGATPTVNSKIVITYTGRLMTGDIFDERTAPNNTATSGPESPWPLSGLIEGWRVGLPLIKEGGHIRLLIPSAMGYGCNGYGAVPGDAVLDFDINLIDVQ